MLPKPPARKGMVSNNTAAAATMAMSGAATKMKGERKAKRFTLLLSPCKN